MPPLHFCRIDLGQAYPQLEELECLGFMPLSCEAAAAPLSQLTRLVIEAGGHSDQVPVSAAELFE